MCVCVYKGYPYIVIPNCHYPRWYTMDIPKDSRASRKWSLRPLPQYSGLTPFLAQVWKKKVLNEYLSIFCSNPETWTGSNAVNTQSLQALPLQRTDTYPHSFYQSLPPYSGMEGTVLSSIPPGPIKPFMVCSRLILGSSLARIILKWTLGSSPLTRHE